MKYLYFGLFSLPITLNIAGRPRGYTMFLPNLSWKWAAPGLALAALCLCVMSTAVSADVHPVNVVEVQNQSSYQVERLFAGRVVGSQRAEIGFELDGKVVKVNVENGQGVRRGDVLAELDTTALRIEQKELQASREEVSARLEQIGRDLQRYRSLSAKGYISQGQLDQLESDQRATRAQINQIEERLRGVAVRLDKARLVATFGGEIANVKIEEGVIVSSGQAVMQLVETGRSEAIFGVSGELGRELVIGQSLPVYSNRGQWLAQVIAVSENLDWRTQTRSVRVALPVDIPHVDGETIQLLVPAHRQQEGFWVTQSALLGDVRGTWAVYQVVGDGDSTRLVKRSVRTRYQHNGRVFVSSELDTGDLIVASGTHRLAPGQAVKVKARVEVDTAQGGESQPAEVAVELSDAQ